MPDTTRYRQRPNEVDAIQWTGHNADALRAFAGIDFATIDPADRVEDLDCDAQLLVEASHWVGIKPTDWVLKFEGYFIAKDDVPFRAVWEPAAPADRAARAAEAAVERVRSVLESEAVVGRSALDYRGLITSALMADEVAPARHTCRNRTTAAGPDWLCPHCSTLPSRMADEAQQPETHATPCSQPNPCEDGGDPCTTHEREQAHTEGDHALCGSDCTAGQPSLGGALRIVADWYASSEGRDVLVEDLTDAGYPLPTEEVTS